MAAPFTVQQPTAAKPPVADPRPDLQQPAEKEQFFRHELNAFLNLAITVGWTAHQSSIECGAKKVENILELAGPGTYKKILDHPSCQMNFIYIQFEAAFNRRKKDILSNTDNLSWTLRHDFTIGYGDGNHPSLKGVCIPLNIIFSLADENRQNLEMVLQGIDPAFITPEDRVRLRHREILVLHLLRIFFAIALGSERITLAISIRALENGLNLSLNDRSIPVAANLGDQLSSGVSSAFSQAFSGAANLMQSLGFKPPPIVAPTDAQLGTMISGMFNSGPIQTIVTGATQRLRENASAQDVVGNIMGSLTGENMRSLTEVTTATVDRAMNSPQEATSTVSLDDTLRNFVGQISQSVGVSNTADLANTSMYPVPGMTPGMGIPIQTAPNPQGPQGQGPQGQGPQGQRPQGQGPQGQGPQGQGPQGQGPQGQGPQGQGPQGQGQPFVPGMNMPNMNVPGGAAVPPPSLAASFIQGQNLAQNISQQVQHTHHIQPMASSSNYVPPSQQPVSQPGLRPTPGLVPSSSGYTVLMPTTISAASSAN